MDKEITDIAPTNLDGTVVNTVKKATEEESEAAALAEKEKKENYYVDPLEQDEIMKEKLRKIEAEKAKTQFDDDDEDDDSGDVYIDTSIRPDMNVSGYFSAGNTARKTSILKRSASNNMLTFGSIVGVTNAIYSVIYLFILITDNFMSPYWFLGWAYIALAAVSIFTLFNGIRSLGVKNDSLKIKAIVSIIGTAFSILPLIAWIIHWIIQS